jgi:hypothetical protein
MISPNEFLLDEISPDEGIWKHRQTASSDPDGHVHRMPCFINKLPGGDRRLVPSVKTAEKQQKHCEL